MCLLGFPHLLKVGVSGVQRAGGTRGWDQRVPWQHRPALSGSQRSERGVSTTSAWSRMDNVRGRCLRSRRRMTGTGASGGQRGPAGARGQPGEHSPAPLPIPGTAGSSFGRAAPARQRRGTRAGIGANESWEITVFSLTRPILRVISIWLRQKDRWPHCLS